ncbi:PAS domain-containing protein, partial [Aliarcobacter butzleri]
MVAQKETVLDDYAFLVSETDKYGVILFANSDFCKIAEYNINELIGQPHSIVRHPDMPKVAFQSLWDTVKSGKVWT